MDYLVATYLCIKQAKDIGVLHRVIFKMGSAAPLSRQLLEDYLSNPAPGEENLWSDYAYKSSSIVTILPSDVNDPNGDPDLTDMNPNSPTYGQIEWDNLKARIDDWMKLPSVIGFEVGFKCEQSDPMLTANITPAQGQVFEGKSLVRYVKDMSYRTGIKWEVPTNCRGIPNGRGSWYDKSNKVAAPYGAYSPNCYDLRGNPEWLINPPGYAEDIRPGFIVTDRPDVLIKICRSLGRLSPATVFEQ